MKLKGKDIILFVLHEGVWRALAYSTSCDIDVNLQYKTISSPDTGKWVRRRLIGINWSGNSAHLVSKSKNENELFDLWNLSKPITIKIGSVEAHPGIVDAAQYKMDGKLGFTGKAIINNLTITGRKGDMVTSSISFNGCGELIQERAPWILESESWNMSGVWINWKHW